MPKKTSVGALALRQLFKLVTRVYFRDIQVRGAKNLPGPGVSGILAGNHASGLVDSLVLMDAFPNLRISCVAKHSLFSAPIIGKFLKTMEAVPVAKARDPNLPLDKQSTAAERKQMNSQMFDTVVDRLHNGVNIAIFPEGTCHSLPEMKELKIGTAKIALEAAAKSNGEKRVPIIPIGLNFTQTSGFAFRSSVLVDVGKPIVITDDLLERFTSGSEGAIEAANTVTKRLEQSLRVVTIAVPDWRFELKRLCERRGWSTPTYKHEASREFRINPVNDESPSNVQTDRKRRKRQKVSVTIDGVDGPGTTSKFVGPVIIEEASSTQRREILLAQGKSVSPPVDLGRAAARKAFFSLSNAVGPLPKLDDTNIVDVMHLARHIYKPNDVKLTLAEYAALTRNFLQGYLQTDALSDKEFDKLWVDLLQYRKEIHAVGVTDKIVASTSTLVDEVQQMRSKAVQDLVKVILETPLSVMGSIMHMPVGAAALAMGNYMGIEKKTGDFSVQATMKCFGAFLGCCVIYPSFAVGVSYYSGSVFAAIPAVGILGYSGLLAADRRPIVSLLRRVRAQTKLLVNKKTMPDLRSQRNDLQNRLRTLVDKYADDDMRGWWNEEGIAKHQSLIRERQLQYESEGTTISSKDEIHNGLADMKQYTIELCGPSKRHEDERAVLTVKQSPGNRKALLWLPGRNDSFFHTHLLDDLMYSFGYDIFALDFRRCGRAKFSKDGVQLTPDLLAHDSHDFYEYYEEIDAALAYLKNPFPRPVGEEDKEVTYKRKKRSKNNKNSKSDTEYATSRILQNGGCGVQYENVIMYAHSTGALAAILYAGERHGIPGGGGGRWRGAIDGFIFNAPFWSWNLPWYQKMVLKNVQLLPQTWKPSELLSGGDHHTPNFDDGFVLESGGEKNENSRNMYKSYKYPTALKCLETTTVSAGWARSVSYVQRMVQRKDIYLEKPTLVLFSEGDNVLDADEVDKFTESLAGAGDRSNVDVLDPSKRSITSGKLVERKIGTSFEEPSGHDVLAAASSIRVDEAMNHILEWTKAHFK